MRSKGRLRPMSEKRKAQQPARDACVRAVKKRAGYRCEVKLESICDGGEFWLDVHEIVPRSAGRFSGSITDPENCVAVCRGCHDHIHNNANWAMENGWKRSRYAGRNQ